ncbi:Midasin [Pseudozyma hubeiensis]|nr:Midasin [Pseudozyma hubeiensis]
MRTFPATAVAGVAAALTLASTASAQLDPSLVTGLSSSCASGLVGLVASSNVSSCLALPNAVGALTSAGNNSVVPGLQSYLSGSICGSGKPVCSTSELSAANATLLQSCSSDLSSNNGANIPALVYYFINSYDKLRNAGCLQNSQSQYCLIEEMYALQNATGRQISFSSIQGLLSNETVQGQSLQALAANKTAFCTDCTHALYSTLFPTNSNQRVMGAVEQTCNSSFVDGKIPSSIKSTAQGNSTSTGSSSGSSTTKSGNGAMGGFGGAIVAVGSAVAAVAAGLTLL